MITLKTNHIYIFSNKLIITFFIVYICYRQIVQCSIKIELINDSWTELRGEIAGPPDTPYEGGKFILEIKVPETYPFNPPKVKKENLQNIFKFYIQYVFFF